MRTLRTAVAAGIASITLLAGQARAEPVYGITDPQFLTSALVSFDSAAPDSMTLIGGITGLGSGLTLRAIDFRPANGKLYALGTSGTVAQLYTMNVAMAVLTAVGSSFTMTGNTSPVVSIDFNPAADRLRVVTGSGQSYRVNADTGALVARDTDIAMGATIADIAYSNNVAGATSTTLYGYDYNADQLDTIGSVGGGTSPNTGQRFVVGDTGLLSGSTMIGLDISGATGKAYGSVFDESNAAINGFYAVDLTTGAFALIGQEAFALSDFAIFLAAPQVAGVPEPSTVAIGGLGLVALVVMRRRRRAAAI